MRGLYAIVDVEALRARGLDVRAFAEAVLEACPVALQLRDKRSGAAETLELLRDLAPLAARAGVPLYANDRPDLAVLARCSGVHLGQDDAPVSVARQVAAAAARDDLRVGLSSHDAGELDLALAASPDYVAIGPVFGTTSKERPAPTLGIDGLTELAVRARAARPDLPLVAIGGVTAETVAAVSAVCESVAVIAALLPAAVDPGLAAGAALAEVRGRARALASAIAAVPNPGGRTGGGGAYHGTTPSGDNA